MRQEAERHRLLQGQDSELRKPQQPESFQRQRMQPQQPRDEDGEVDDPYIYWTDDDLGRGLRIRRKHFLGEAHSLTMERSGALSSSSAAPDSKTGSNTKAVVVEVVIDPRTVASDAARVSRMVNLPLGLLLDGACCVTCSRFDDLF